MRINDQITARQVRLIDESGKQLGVMQINDALSLASDKQLDLVEVAPTSEPVVCKLLDYGRFSYQEKKKRNDARGRQRTTSLKMVKFRPNTFAGDFETKLQRIRKFLGDGDQVKAVMQFRGREIVHMQNGFEVFKKLAEQISDIGHVDSAPGAEGKFIHMMISPLPARLRKKESINGAGAETEDEQAEQAEADKTS